MINRVTGIELCGHCHNYVKPIINTREIRNPDEKIVRWDVSLNCSECGCFLYSYSAYPGSKGEGK